MRLAERAAESERLRRLPSSTIDEFRASDLPGLLLPSRYGGSQRCFPEFFDTVRQMAHGCTSSAWTLSFYMLHNWMLSLFDQQTQNEILADGPVLAPAPLAPTGKGCLVDGGISLTGRWSWATGIMDADWVIVGALVVHDEVPRPVLAVLPADQVSVEDVWHTAGMRGTGSNDVVVHDVFVPAHRLVDIADIYAGSTPGAQLHNASAYRWPMVPALALTASMAVLGTTERVVQLLEQRLAERALAYSGTKQRDQPIARARLGESLIRMDALRSLTRDIAEGIELTVCAGLKVSRSVRIQARLAAAHTVHECRAIIANLAESAGASAHFLDNPIQRAKRDVDMVSGHAVFDYDISRDLMGMAALGLKLPPFAML